MKQKILRSVLQALAFITAFTLIMLLNGCGRSDAAQQGGVLTVVTKAIGLAEEPLPDAELVDLVLDASEGSPASLVTAEAAIDGALTYAAARPGTRVRVWALGMEVADTTMLTFVESTAPKRRGERARIVEAQRFIAASKPVLMQAILPVFDRPAKKQSPIAEGLSKVAYSRAPRGMQRHIVLITDARQVGGVLKFDFECGNVPDPATFVERLQKHVILAPDTLPNTTVHFAYVALEAVPKRPGCSVTLARAKAIETAWRAAVTAAGATEVFFTTDAPQLQTPVAAGGAS